MATFPTSGLNHCDKCFKGLNNHRRWKEKFPLRQGKIFLYSEGRVLGGTSLDNLEMNLQCVKPLPPLRVLLINPLSPASHLIAMKILSGRAFGAEQQVMLTLLVFSNEALLAKNLKYELESCAFQCTYSIEVSSDVPRITDADVFCFMTHLSNPNTPDFAELESDSQFDSFYLLLKIGNGLEYITPEPEKITLKKLDLKARMPKYNYVDEPKPIKPIIIADGLLALDIIRCASRNLPSDISFCPTPINAIAKSILAEYLKVQRSAINEVHTWGVTDEQFHVEIEKPIIKHDQPDTEFCDWDAVSKEKLDSFSWDHTQFNAAWLKKDFIDKIKVNALKNPYGHIYTASNFVNTLNRIWAARIAKGESKHLSLGVISDGSMGTIKGLPYVMPVILSGDTFKVNTLFEEDVHLKQEILNYNKVAKKNHNKLFRHCKRFLEKNVLEMAFAENLDSTTASTLTPPSITLSRRIGSSETGPPPVEREPGPYLPIRNMCADFVNI